MEDIKTDFTTPSEFYKWKRPENFSDSKVVATLIFPREQLAYELNTISTNQKHDLFENMCRKIAEKLICPNLIPQVGPTGGGDGKTDSETYPVSRFISDRWFIGNNDWDGKENWAFAISAKEDWRAKVRSDVKKIVETNRGYTKIFFFTNRKVSSKKKKETQDLLRSNYGVDVIILDAEWLIDKIYSNRLLNDVIETLNLSREYREAIELGPMDIERVAELEELERDISSSSRKVEVDYSLVENCLQSAMCARGLEYPKTDVFGRFDRANRFAEKLGNHQLIIRVLYQTAWTYINYYDDYEQFYITFKKFKQKIHEALTLKNIEFYFNLFNIIRTISNVPEVKDVVTIPYSQEETDFVNLLSDYSKKDERHTTALLCSFYLSIIQLFTDIELGHDTSNQVIKLKKLFSQSERYIEIPFDQLRDLIKVLGEYLPFSAEFDELLDVIAEIESIRVSELSSAEIYLERGYTKLNNKLYQPSLIYFGKASRKLAKEESKEKFFLCLLLLSDAYKGLGLYWASYTSLVAAASIYSRVFFDTGHLDTKFVRIVESILKTELIIGRLPVLLCWYELDRVLRLQFSEEEVNFTSSDEIPSKHLVDLCLAVRLLNEPYPSIKEYSILPDILSQQGLWMSSDAVLYLLGHDDKIDIGDNTKINLDGSFEEYYNKFAQQPFADQILYSTDLLDNETSQIRSNILGVQVSLNITQNHDLYVLGELIIAFLESYLATAFEQSMPIVERANIELSIGSLNGPFEVQNKSNAFLNIVLDKSFRFSSTEIRELLDIIVPNFIAQCYVINNAFNFLQTIYEKDEIQERLSLIIEHRAFLIGILTNTPKLYLSHWINSKMNSYQMRREKSPIRINPKPSSYDMNTFDRQNVSHINMRSETIINTSLWNEATWRGFGFLSMPSIPFGIILAYKNISAGKKIFEEWIGRFGEIDAEDTISLSIITGISKHNPYWYKVLISKKVRQENMEEGIFWTLGSRFHLMEARSNQNLNNLIAGFQQFKKFHLLPASIDDNLNIVPIPELRILKHDLILKEAWTIGIHDLERVVITADDDPIIPRDQKDAPVLEILKQRG